MSRNLHGGLRCFDCRSLYLLDGIVHSNDSRPCLRWVIHVIPAIPTCPVRSKSGHSTNARVYEYTRLSLIQPIASVALADAACSLVRTHS